MTEMEDTTPQNLPEDVNGIGCHMTFGKPWILSRPITDRC